MIEMLGYGHYKFTCDICAYSAEVKGNNLFYCLYVIKKIGWNVIKLRDGWRYFCSKCLS